MQAPVVIVGASIGGVRTAQALRAAGHQGAITLIGAEPDLPYDKPPLSKQFLAGDWDEPRIRLLDHGAADDAGIDLRLGVAATGLDLPARTLQLADGKRLPYSALVLATGSVARPSPWRASSGVHVLRTLQDGRALRAALQRTGPLVIIGGGFVGAEVAGTARAAGREVTIVDPLSAPAERVAGATVGGLLAEVHGRHGVNASFGVGVTEIEGHEGALTVTLTDGTALPADSVLVGIGAEPATDWLAASGLPLDDGVICGEDCRTVDGADVYAVGDCARWRHPRHEETVRVEHWTNAAEQATVVAHNIVHPDDARPHAPTEYVWSDQYDWRIQIAGRPGACAAPELIGEPDAELPRFIALHRDPAGRIGGAVAVNWARALIGARRQIAEGATYEDALEAAGALTVPGPR